ncbi:Flp family type IVb pilin [Bryocella elongata]|nr:Flp family type IVb pilin [Bryocella elongata]
MMLWAAPLLFRFLVEENGQDLVEYALVAGCIGLAAIASLKILTNGISNVFSGVGSTLTSAT